MITAFEEVENRILLHPSGAAVGSLTYGELGSYVAGVSESLRSEGVAAGDLVAIHSGRTQWLVPAMLGVWKLGAAFAIVDIAHPAAAKENYLRQCRFKASLSTSNPPPKRLFARTNPPGVDETAYVAFTSGSTGVPRGVVGTHGPLGHFFAWQAERFGLQAADRFAMLSGLGHDPLLRDILAPLRIGASLSVPEDGTLRDPSLLIGWLDEQRITVAHLTPTLGQFLELGAELRGRRLLHLRYLFFGGELLPRKLAAACLQFAPNATVVNFYGATETPQAMGYHVYDPARAYEGRSIPLGRGIDDVELLLEEGEIVIRTPHLSKGYLNDAEATSARFRNGTYRTGDLGFADAYGEIVYAGRRDSQAKIAGHRVEPSETAAVLELHPGISRAVVTPLRDGLAAYFTGETIAPGVLRAWLGDRLPAYMVPATLIHVDSFPITRNGKVDVAALRELAAEDPPEQIESDTEPEGTIARLFAEVLGRQWVGRYDNFFELGGTSLAAARLMAGLERSLGIRVPLALLLEAATPAALAARLSKGFAQAWLPLVCIHAGDVLQTPLFLVHAIGGNVLTYRELGQHLDGRPCYGLQSSGGQNEPEPSIEAKAERYLAQIRGVQSSGPYLLGGYSAGGLVAFEMARQLVRAGEQVAAVLLFDTRIARQHPLPKLMLRKAWRNATSFFRLTPATRREFLRKKWVNTRVNLDLARARWSTSVSKHPETAFRVAESRYVPSAYDRRVILFRNPRGHLRRPRRHEGKLVARGRQAAISGLPRRSRRYVRAAASGQSGRHGSRVSGGSAAANPGARLGPAVNRSWAAVRCYIWD